MSITRTDYSRSKFDGLAGFVVWKLFSRLTQSPRSILATVSTKRVHLRKPRTSFHKLIQGQKFDKLISILQDDTCNFQTWLPQSSEMPRCQSALHMILQHRPPVEIVDTLLIRMRQVNKDEFPEIAQDDSGMTPLHVAVARSCDPDVISRLLPVKYTTACDSNAAAIIDRYQRYPLHYICSNPSRIRKKVLSDNPDNTFEDTLRIVDLLVTAFPSATTSFDTYGWTPKAMAEHLNADINVLQLLDFTSKMISTCNDDPLHAGGIHDVTPTVSTCDSSAETFPVDEICFLRNEDGNDVDDDVSSIGWNDGKKFAYPCSYQIRRKPVEIDVLHLSISEIHVPVVSCETKDLHKFRFL
jgi:hypothetical protein